MKKLISIILCSMFLLLLVACTNGINKSYEEGYDIGYSEGHSVGYDEGKKLSELRLARFSGSFTATVEQLLPDYYALEGKTVAVVHFFNDAPFLLHFNEDLSDKLVEGKTYVFSFKTFDVSIPIDEEYPRISDYMYSIEVTDYREAEKNEIGLDSIMPSCEIITE